MGGIPIRAQILPGAQQTEQYLTLLQNKKVGVVAHAASEIYTNNSVTHLIDSLLAHRIDIKKIFAPEHGFRSREDNGAIIKDEIDARTQLPIISLHGKNKKPQPEQLANLDLILFDLQDVGARFYTYLSTLHLMMEACAENNIVKNIKNSNIMESSIIELNEEDRIEEIANIFSGSSLSEASRKVAKELLLKK